MRCDSSFGDALPTQTGTRTATVAVVAPPNFPRYNHYVATFTISGEALPKVFGILKFARALGGTAGPIIVLTSATVHYSTTEALPSKLANVSTRAVVGTGDNVLIGGFIVTGSQPKKIIARAIGPSLPVSGKLADPTLELRDGNGGLISGNDNWRSDQENEIIASTVPPMNDLESAIVATLPANNGYTAIVRGAGNTTGVGLVEVYELP